MTAQPRSLLLESIGTVVIPATEKSFSARKKFVVNTDPGAAVKISWLDWNFRLRFLEKIENPVAEATLCYAKLIKSSHNGSILAELGEGAETTLAQMYALMERQPHGQEGVLLTNGWANIFYVDINGKLHAVRVLWRGGGWFVPADPVTFPHGRGGEDRVFSRNS